MPGSIFRRAKKGVKALDESLCPLLKETSKACESSTLPFSGLPRDFQFNTDETDCTYFRLPSPTNPPTSGEYGSNKTLSPTHENFENTKKTFSLEWKSTPEATMKVMSQLRRDTESDVVLFPEAGKTQDSWVIFSQNQPSVQSDSTFTVNASPSQNLSAGQPLIGTQSVEVGVQEGDLLNNADDTIKWRPVDQKVKVAELRARAAEFVKIKKTLLAIKMRMEALARAAEERSVVEREEAALKRKEDAEAAEHIYQVGLIMKEVSKTLGGVKTRIEALEVGLQKLNSGMQKSPETLSEIKTKVNSLELGLQDLKTRMKEIQDDHKKRNKRFKKFVILFLYFCFCFWLLFRFW